MTSPARLLALVVACVLAALASMPACGGSTIAGLVDAGPPCDQYAQAWCAKKQSCSNGTLITRDWGDMQTCITRQTLSCNDGLSAANTGQSSSLIVRCAQALPSASCSDLQDGTLPTECRPAGPGASGSACAVNAQCTSGYCSGNRYAVCGTCADPPAAAASCPSNNCGHGQECVWNAMVTNVCEPFVTTGAVCGPFQNPPCAADLGCAGASTTENTSGICQQAIATAGTTCGSKNQNLNCDGLLGLWCLADASNNYVCTNITYAEDGTPCGHINGGIVECKSGTCYSASGPFFDTTGASSTGTCKAFAADGAACDTAMGPTCLSPARCITTGSGTSGTCTAPTSSVTSMCH
jgi:hypothetical protein